MKHFKKIIASCVTSTMLIPAAAFAQDAPQADSEANDGVIIVTAQRRAQDVQEIPLAVTAVSPEQLEQQGVVNVQNIGSVSPSFSTSQAQTASGTVVLRIRGVGTTSNNIGFESAVGIFVDGAYQSRPGVALSEFVDVERVEVLRGPQGTLFGRNTSAGALNITNKRPDLNEFGGFVNATYGNLDHMSIQGAVNVPLVKDSVAARITGAYRKRDGHISLVDSTGADLGDSGGADQYLVRGQIGFETDGGIRGRLIGDFSNSSANCCAAVEVRAADAELGGLLAGLLGPRAGQFGPLPATDSFDQPAAEAAVSRLLGTVNSAPMTDVDQWGITGELEFPLGENADLILIGSYRDFSSMEAYDSDFSGLDAFNVTGLETDIETFTAEARLQGEALGGKLSWLIGGFYSDESIQQTQSFELGPDYDSLIGLLFGGLAGPTPVATFTGVSPVGATSSNFYTQDSSSWSLFTHNTFDLTDRLSVTLGARWSDDNKSGSYSQTAINNGGVCNATLAGFAGYPAALQGGLLVGGCFAFLAPADSPLSVAFPTPRSFDEDFNDEELIYTAKLGYDLDNVNLYASFTHGYKSGGFNLDSTSAVVSNFPATLFGDAPIFGDPSFRSETVDAYEIGVKGKFLDNALTVNVAAFYQDFKDFQVLEFTGTRFETFNVPIARSQGVEIEMTARPNDNFTFTGGLTYTDAEYPDNCAGPTDIVRAQNLCGFSLTNAPQIVAIAGATFEDEIGSNLKFFLNGQVRAESDRRTSTQGQLVPDTAADIGTTAPLAFDVQDGNVKINLRAGIGDTNDAWGIEAWVTNLTNQITRGVTFNTALRGTGAGGGRSAFPQEPRLYGVTLRGAF